LKAKAQEIKIPLQQKQTNQPNSVKAVCGNGNKPSKKLIRFKNEVIEGTQSTLTSAQITARKTQNQDKFSIKQNG